MRKTLTTFLARPPARGGMRCVCCQMPELSADVREFLKAVAAGKTKQAFNAFYTEYVIVQYPDSPCANALKNHARRCLDLDPMTGKPIR